MMLIQAKKITPILSTILLMISILSAPSASAKSIEKMTTGPNQLDTSKLLLTAVQLGSSKDQELNKEELRDSMKTSVEFMIGPVHSPTGLGPNHANWDYVLSSIRVCKVFTETRQNLIFPEGNFEGILGFNYGRITQGWGNNFWGVSLLARYNLKINERFTPYFQIGAGIILNDAYKDRGQRVIGQRKEYTPQASIGVDYHFGKDMTFKIEAIFHHISNRGEAERNLGSNGAGVLIGGRISTKAFGRWIEKIF